MNNIDPTINLVHKILITRSGTFIYKKSSIVYHKEDMLVDVKIYITKNRFRSPKKSLSPLIYIYEIGNYK